MGGVASVFASFEEEGGKGGKGARGYPPPPPPPPPGMMKRQMRFRALDRVHAFKSGGNTFERLDHVCVDGEEKKLFRALMS